MPAVKYGELDHGPLLRKFQDKFGYEILKPTGWEPYDNMRKIFEETTSIDFDQAREIAMEVCPAEAENI